MVDPQLPEPRLPKVCGRDLVPIRFGPRRVPDWRQRRLLGREDRARARIAELDQQLVELSIERKELLAEIRAVHEELRPCYTSSRGRRRRAIVDEEPLPPVQPGAEELCGRELRAVCLTLLRRARRALTLRQLHCLLHRVGYAIAHQLPAKVLADALGHEADAGRVERVRRGTYQITGHPPDDLPAALPDW
jgi:hypothetical protein